MPDEIFDADILQADGVEHAADRLGDARRGVARLRLEGDALGNQAAEAVDVHQLGVFLAVSESTRSGEDGILQLDAGDVDRQIRFLRLFSLFTLTAHHDLHPSQYPLSSPIRLQSSWGA